MMHTKKNRGQGTTEYLIILAIVIVIALVVVGVLGGIPSLGAGVSESTSKTYWAGTSPIAVVEWQIGTTTGNLVVKNLTAGTIRITDVNWGGVDTTPTADVNIGAGSTAVLTDTEYACGVTVGQTFSKALGFTYNTANLTGLKFNGIQPVVGQCQ